LWAIIGILEYLPKSGILCTYVIKYTRKYDLNTEKYFTTHQSPNEKIFNQLFDIYKNKLDKNIWFDDLLVIKE